MKELFNKKMIIVGLLFCLTIILTSSCAGTTKKGGGCPGQNFKLSICK